MNVSSIRYIRKWSDESLARLSQRLSYLLDAGIPLLDSLQLTLHHFSRREREELQRVLEQLEAGIPLSAALEKLSAPPIFLSFIAAGELHGHYASSFGFAARYYRRRVAWRHQLYQLLSYPSLLLVLSLACLWFLLHVILPQLSSMYDTMNITLPPLTRLFLSTFVLFSSYSLPIIAVASVGAVIIWKLCHSHRLTLYMLRMPYVRYWLTLQYSHYFAMQAGLLLEAGVSILAVCHLLRVRSPWSFLRQIAEEIEEELRQGRMLSASLQNHACFTPELLRYVELGEEGGRIGECLLFYSEQTETDMKHQIEKLMRWLEPLILLGIGSIVFIVVLSFFLPVLHMMNEVK